MQCLAAMKINTKLLPVKVTYFLTLGGVASLLPYLAVYMMQIGLSASETAIIYGTMPFLGAFVRILAGGIADRLHKHKATLMVCCLLSGVFHGLLLLVPSRVTSSEVVRNVTLGCGDVPSSVQWCMRSPGCSNDVSYSVENTTKSSRSFTDVMCTLHCCDSDICFLGSSNRSCVSPSSCFDISIETLQYEGVNAQFSSQCPLYTSQYFQFEGRKFSQVVCSNYSTSFCELKCSQNVAISCDASPSSGQEESHKFDSTFWMFFWICLVGQMFFSPIFSLIDAMTYDYLGDEYGKWGWQRVWGTVGFGILAVVSGLIMDVYKSGNSEKNYTFAFVAFAVLNFAASIMVFFYKISPSFACKQMFSNISMVLKNMEILTLLIVMTIFGTYTGVIETFLYWYLSTIGGNQLLFGLCMLVSCIGEVPVLLAAGHFIAFLGHVNCLFMALAAYGIRLIAYTFLVDPWYVLFIEPSQAVCFGLMYASASSYASILTPPGMHGTVQGLLGALYFGIGKGLGSVVGGVVYERYEAKVTFRAYGVSAFIFLFLYVAIYHLLIKPHKKRQREQTAVDENGAVEKKMIEGDKDDGKSSDDETKDETTKPLNV